MELRIPALRDRRGDIPLLAAHFLAHHAERYRRQLQGLTPEALDALLHHSWPGNVRELDHTLERAVLMARGSHVEVADLGLHGSRTSREALDDLSLDAVEAVLVRKALARVNGNITQAAELLGLSRGSLYRRLEKHGIAT